MLYIQRCYVNPDQFESFPRARYTITVSVTSFQTPAWALLSKRSIIGWSHLLKGISMNKHALLLLGCPFGSASPSLSLESIPIPLFGLLIRHITRNDLFLDQASGTYLGTNFMSVDPESGSAD